jgi:hypothetical protein
MATLLLGVIMGLAMVQTGYAYQVKFETQDYFAWGRLYDAAGTPLNLNPYYTANPQGGDDGTAQALSPLDTYHAGDGKEDAFGITKISRIASPDGTTTYFQSDATKELKAFFYGADDVFISSANVLGQQTLVSNGFTVEIWLDYTPEYITTQGTGGRSNGADPTFYNHVTDGDGVLALKLVGHTQYLDYPALTKPYTLQETGFPATGDFTGSILFDVVDGIWKDVYDTNTIAGMQTGTFADFRFTFSTHGAPGVADWLIGDTSSALGEAVPEPSTMLLFGISMLGLATLKRKKAA